MKRREFMKGVYRGALTAGYVAAFGVPQQQLAYVGTYSPAEGQIMWYGVTEWHWMNDIAAIPVGEAKVVEV